VTGGPLPTHLSGWRDRHTGQTIVVCGCGRSLLDLPEPQRWITIGVNDVGRLFDPTYLVVLNPRSQFSADRFRHVSESRAFAVFTQLDAAQLGVTHPRVVRFRLGRRGGTDLAALDTLPYTRNSPYVAVCLAAFLGARRIGLIGVDLTDHHFFGDTGAHPLAREMAAIDQEYGRLAVALASGGVELVNLSRASRLSTLPKAVPVTFLASAAPGEAELPGAPANLGSMLPAAGEARMDGVSPVNPNVDVPLKDDAPISGPSEPPLNIVSYATTPVAGVPAILARCIAARTHHGARCVWADRHYGNGVSFEGDIEWRRSPAEAEAVLDAADIVIVHNGKVDPRHQRVLANKAVVTMAHNYRWNVDDRFVAAGYPGVVVGQYQATLPDFPGWAVVPNPVPVWEPPFQPAEKPPVPTLCYTPSARHERYPEGHRLYWHAKGYDTTLRVLDRLARTHDLRLEVVRTGQVSHAESLAMKRGSHIVIDECVTGSYHRNSLEGLATGCVVVNGVGLRPGVVAALERCAPETDRVPFVFSHLEGLEQTLVGLVQDGPDTLATAGAANRAWMERHWDFGSQWERCWWPAAVVALERRGRRHRSIPPARNPGSVPQRSARRRVEEHRISVVIPHGGVDRLPHLAATLASLRRHAAVGEIIVAEMGAVPAAEEIALRWADRFAFVQHPGPFERARALNVGSDLAECPWVLWVDNDILCGPEFVARALEEMVSRGLDYLIPYSTVRYLSDADSRRVMSGAVEPSACRPAAIWYSSHGRPTCCGGVGLVTRDFLRRFGGLVEGFRGWGGEDNAWIHKATLLGRSCPTLLPNQHVHHLFHAASGGYPQHAPALRNPYYEQNLALLNRVWEIREAERFLQLFPAHQPSGETPEIECARVIHRDATPVEPSSAIEPGNGKAMMLPEEVSRLDAASGIDSANPTVHPIPVWTYWEGPCPDWIESCHRTIVAHAPGARMLTPESFDGLRNRDRDVDLSRLTPAQRADFIRAFLLARFGGLWIDSDCLVMQPLQPVLDLLRTQDFVAHRERSGWISNGFIGARPKSRIADQFYRRLCQILREGRPLIWFSLGGQPLTEILNQTRVPWHELPCTRVQPICWSEPAAFFAPAEETSHDRFDPDAVCYMLSKTEVDRHVAANPGASLTKSGTLFDFLLRAALARANGVRVACEADDCPKGAAARAPEPLESVFAGFVESYRSWRIESMSGPGSSLRNTLELRRHLPRLFATLKVRSLLDAACGDFHWMRRIQPGRDYVGVDLLEELVAGNQRRYGGPNRRFLRLDIRRDPLPAADCVICRDCLVHLSFEDTFEALRNFKRSGAQYLLTTTFTADRPNFDTSRGEWRTLNLERTPFEFPRPLHIIDECCAEAQGTYSDKALGLWRLADLPV
jgi:hypothetical protein